MGSRETKSTPYNGLLPGVEMLVYDRLREELDVHTLTQAFEVMIKI